jgi:hypothetical protein
MAVTFSKKAQQLLFTHLFGEVWTTQNIDPLLAAGVTLGVEFTAIVAQWKMDGGQHSEKLQLPISTTALMKGSGDPSFSADAKTKIRDFIHNIQKILGLPTVTPGALIPDPVWLNNFGSEGVTIHTSSKGGAGGSSGAFSSGGGGGSGSWPMGVIPSGEPAGDSLVEKLYKSMEASTAKKKANKPTGDVIKLRDAKALGQKVRGTSNGSVYVVVALNDRVKIAAKIKGTQVSVRAECNNPTATEKNGLLSIGLKPGANGDHYSFHLDCQEVPVGRALGACLFDCDVEFEQQITSLKNISELGQ